MRRWTARKSLAFATFLLCFNLSVATGFAQDAGSTVADAYEAYDNLEIDRALELIDTVVAGDSSEEAAAAWVLRGLIELNIEDNRAGAVEAFRNALEEDENSAVDDLYITAAVSDAMDTAIALEAAGEPPSGEQAALIHTVPDVVIRGQNLPITARLIAEGAVARIVLLYRADSGDEYAGKDLVALANGTSFYTEIHAREFREGDAVEYVLLAYDSSGDVVETVGSRQEPITVDVQGLNEPISLDDVSPVADEQFHFAIGLGSGFGVATGDPVTYGDSVDLAAGYAPAPLEFYAEVGASPMRHLHIVLAGKLQTVFLPEKVDLRPQGRLLARYFVIDRVPWRAGISAGFGYGDQVHLVRLNEVVQDGEGNRIVVDDTDRTLEGPWHAGAGGFFVYMFNERVGVFADLFVAAFFPTPSGHLDVNVGVYVGF